MMSEYLDVVDESNLVLYKEKRDEIHSIGLWHRGVHVLLFRSGERMLLPIRSPSKDKYPNCYDTSISEHCKLGETYANAALRGLMEELKITNPDLKLLGIFKIDCEPTDRMISAVFKCSYDGKIEIDEDEITNIEFKSTSELNDMLETDLDKFAPWTRDILRWYFHKPSRALRRIDNQL